MVVPNSFVLMLRDLFDIEVTRSSVGLFSAGVLQSYAASLLLFICYIIDYSGSSPTQLSSYKDIFADGTLVVITSLTRTSSPLRKNYRQQSEP